MFSFSESKEDVASSNIRTGGLFIKALAIAILYIYPPDSLDPFSPTIVSRPFGKLYTSFMKI